VGPVNAVGKITCSLGDGYARFLHETHYQIDFTYFVKSHPLNLAFAGHRKNTFHVTNLPYAKNTLELKTVGWVSG
jgi:hypothetical protein